MTNSGINRKTSSAGTGIFWFGASPKSNCATFSKNKATIYVNYARAGVLSIKNVFHLINSATSSGIFSNHLCKEYSIGRRRECNEKTGAARVKQNSREIRPGNRLKLFRLMRDMYLDKLAMAGGEGSKLLRRIKYDALREYRIKNGWGGRRP